VTFTQQLVLSTPGDLHYYRDNFSTMRREAVSVVYGTVDAWISAAMLCSLSDEGKVQMGSIAHAPWGSIRSIGGKEPT